MICKKIIAILTVKRTIKTHEKYAKNMMKIKNLHKIISGCIYEYKVIYYKHRSNEIKLLNELYLKS